MLIPHVINWHMIPLIYTADILCNIGITNSLWHYNDVIMTTMASQITSLTVVYSIVYPDADQRKHLSSASLAFMWGIHRGPVNSPHKLPVTLKMFPFDDVIMTARCYNVRPTMLWLVLVCLLGTVSCGKFYIIIIILPTYMYKLNINTTGNYIMSYLYPDTHPNSCLTVIFGMLTTLKYWTGYKINFDLISQMGVTFSMSTLKINYGLNMYFKFHTAVSVNVKQHVVQCLHFRQSFIVIVKPLSILLLGLAVHQIVICLHEAE